MTTLKNLRVRTVLQRCSNADVFIAGETRGQLKSGLIALVGFSLAGDESADALLERIVSCEPQARASLFSDTYGRWWSKVSQLRLFSDDAGKMNLSLLQMPNDCGIYLVSQFTLFADIRKGNRPGFSGALSASLAKVCFEQLVGFVAQNCLGRPNHSGVFGTDMRVSFVNEGPVTIMFDYSAAEGFVVL